MISINNNEVLINVDNCRLHQTFHHETGKPFQSEKECFDWIVESGWFERCKAAAILHLKAKAQTLIHEKAPPFKQVNAALGISSRDEIKQITQIIKTVKDAVEQKEKSILEASTMSSFLNELNEPLVVEQTH